MCDECTTTTSKILKDHMSDGHRQWRMVSVECNKALCVRHIWKVAKGESLRVVCMVDLSNTHDRYTIGGCCSNFVLFCRVC